MNAPAGEWLEALRRECRRSSQARAAARIGYSAAVVNQVLKGTYNGDLQRVQLAVEGALLGATVECPVLGEMRRDVCLGHQGREFAATSPLRVRLYHACRNGCPHSRVGGER